MSDRLAEFRSRLAALRRTRARTRCLAALAAAALAVFAALAGLYVLDLLFRLAPGQRLVAMFLALAGVLVAAWRYAWPLVRQQETLFDLALLVERQERIDSDLVAALEFESPHAAPGASPALRQAVIEQTAARARRLDLADLASRALLTRRAQALAMALAVGLATAALWPQHLAVFANRLLLGSRHYPTRTHIELVLVNDEPVLRGGGVRPAEVRAPQGRPLALLVKCSGQLPAEANAQLQSQGPERLRTRLVLKALTLDQRRGHLERAAQALEEARAAPAGPLTLAWKRELAPLVAGDAPAALELLRAAQRATDLAAPLALLREKLAGWPGDAARFALLRAEMPRLNDDLTYTLAAGDARTERGTIRLIPAPLVKLNLVVAPPPYAADEALPASENARQPAVLEGSSLALSLECTNRKPLAAAWVVLHSGGTSQRVDLAPGEQPFLRVLPAAGTPLAKVRREVRYEAQVVDADGLSLETPLRGTIRVRPDQLPTATIQTVHKVVLPTARPRIAFRASDDFGIGGLALVVQVERATPTASAGGAAPGASPSGALPTASDATTLETHRLAIAAELPARSEALPLTGEHPLDLVPLRLAKGDRLKLTLEATDARGQNEEGGPLGETQASDPLVLEISDEAGVLAAISAADKQSADRLSEIIQRELGIGESP